MNEQDKQKIAVKDTTNQPSTADIARAMDNTTPRGDTSPAHRVPGETELEGGRPSPLFPQDQSGELHTRWTDIQASFVDDPRQAVQQADALVADVMKRLAETFAHERSNLEGQWSRGDNVSTEDLRVAFRRYRSFFDRLLSL